MSTCFQRRGNNGSLPFSFISLVLTATRPSSVSNRLVPHPAEMSIGHSLPPPETSTQLITQQPFQDAAAHGRQSWRFSSTQTYSMPRAVQEHWALPTSLEVGAGACQQGKQRVVMGG